MTKKLPITVAYGDGIGPEIMAATLKILDAAKAPLDYDVIEVGEKVYKKGFSSGIPDDAWASIERTNVLLKAPITTPQGGGYKSLNVTIRKSLGLFANVRPCRALSPYVKTHYPKTDLVVVRENEEDLYAGIEHRQTNDVFQCLKLISRSGSERIMRYAFEYAKKFNRKKVTCFSKDNIMKMTDGLFHQVFNEIAQEYPNIEHDHKIVDIGTALIAADPEQFDVIVTENLYGDIISDVAAQVVGSVGMAGSSNVGDNCAMFEAIHGSAPDIAGKDIANPSGLLNGAIMMLIHLNLAEMASSIQNAWFKTLEDGVHTCDIYQEGVSQEKVGTMAFADAVIARLGQLPETFPVAEYHKAKNQSKIVCLDKRDQHSVKKTLVGVDVFLDANVSSADSLGEALSVLDSALKLVVITSRGLKMWPDGHKESHKTDHWRCRFMAKGSRAHFQQEDILRLLSVVVEAGFEVIKTENLYDFDGVHGFTLAQGQ